MRQWFSTLLAAAIAVAGTACSDTTMPTTSAPASLRADRSSHEHMKTVRMLDECDATTFNQVIGPGTCIRNGGLTFEKFIDQLTHLQAAPGWRFSPENVTLRVGDLLAATNIGGEEHTFTEVEEFGGGLVGLLNTLSGNPIIAPECRELAPGDFVPPGGTVTETVTEEGDEKYQCCIHPWMRATVHVGKK